jgi:hypothetical protein
MATELSYKERMRMEREEAARLQAEREAAKKNRLPVFSPPRDEKGGIEKCRVRILPGKDGQDPIKKSFMLWKLSNMAGLKYTFSEPYQTWDVENPISEFYNDLRKSNYDLFKEIKPVEGWNVIVLDRADEDAGPKIWTLSYPLFKALEKFILDDSNFEDEDLFSLELGFEFEVITQHAKDPNGKPKMYNNKKTYETTLNPLIKTKGPVFGDKKGNPDTERIEELMAKVPSWDNVFPIPEMDAMEELMTSVRERVLGDSPDSGSKTASKQSSKSGGKHVEEEDELDDQATADQFESLLNG